jgi:uncharacterized RDD family membrane protein YckC
MTPVYYPIRRIESIYPPEQLRTAGPGRRLVGNLLDGVLPFVLFYALLIFVIAAAAADDPSTSSDDSDAAAAILIAMVLFIAGLIGWVVWWCITAANGQSPAKQMLSMYVMKEDGTRAGFGTILLRELIIKGVLGTVINIFTFGIYGLLAALWCLWDRDHQCLWDKIGSTYVAWSPMGYKPGTASEYWRSGMQPPALQAAQPPAVP